MITIKPIDIEDAHADIVQNALKKHLPEGVRVYAFGSRANWQAKRASDLDLAIDADTTLKRNIDDLQEELSQSDLPYKVDIVNLNTIADSFSEAITKDLVPILWDWTKTTLGEHIHVKHGYAFKGKDITKKPTNDILVTPGNFYIGGGFKAGKFKYFNSEYPKSYALKKNDIVVTMTDLSKEGDTLGYAAKIPEIKDKTFLHNQRIGLVEFLSNDVDSDFIYWLMRTREYQGFIIGAASGTSIRHTSPTSVKGYDFQLPSLPEQKAIAGVLSCLDDKIDLLHRQNKTLESLAETLFRRWFIEEAQDDWEEGVLGDVCDIYGGYAFKSKDFIDDGIPIVKIKNISNNRVELLGKQFVSQEIASSVQPKFRLTNGDIVMAMTGATIGKVGLINSLEYEFLLLNQRVAVIRGKYQALLWFMLNTINLENDIINAANGAAQANISSDGIASVKIPKIDKNKAEEFNLIIEPMFSKILKNQKQIKTLESLRDTLLPKLMSGDVRVEFETNLQAEAV